MTKRRDALTALIHARLSISLFPFRPSYALDVYGRVILCGPFWVYLRVSSHVTLQSICFTVMCCFTVNLLETILDYGTLIVSYVRHRGYHPVLHHGLHRVRGYHHASGTLVGHFYHLVFGTTGLRPPPHVGHTCDALHVRVHALYRHVL